jgi:hypothetical protein
MPSLMKRSSSALVSPVPISRIRGCRAFVMI